MNRLYMLGTFNAQVRQTRAIHASDLMYLQFRDDLGKLSNKL